MKSALILLTLILITISILIGVTGCGQIGYYGQAARGQWEVMSARQPISQLIEDPATDAALRERLRLIQALTQFAHTELALPNSGSYRQYADLNRPYVVWNVFATPELSLEPHQSCYPLVGCLAYRGYFREAAAEHYAKRLIDEGYDVYVGGVQAYSTLGWFDDPVLNTWIHRPEQSLAGLLFHELAHERFYADHDTAFNESFAVTVELEGVKQWLNRAEARSTPAERSAILADYEAKIARRADFAALIEGTRAALEAIYQSEADQAQKSEQKEAAFEALKRRYQQLKQQCWEGYAGYDRWFDRPLNNAHLAAVSLYRRRVPAFQALLHQHGGDLIAFYSAVEELGGLERSERDARLDALAVEAPLERLRGRVASPQRAICLPPLKTHNS